MKILIPVIEFGKSGGYRVLSQYANWWISQGHHVDFLCMNAITEPYFPTEATIIRINSIKEHHKDNIIIKYHKMIKYIESTDNKYDVILSNYNLTAYIVWLAKTKSKKFYYIQAYEPEMVYNLFKGFKKYFFTFLAWYSYYLPLRRVVNASIYLEYKNIRAKLRALPCLDFDIYQPKQESINTDSVITIGCIGRKEKYKGSYIVYDVFNKLRLKYPNKKFKLLIAFGEYNETDPDIVNIIPKNDLELAAFYRSNSIHIATSFIQLGAVHYPVIESMSSGVPCVNFGYYPADQSNSWIAKVNDSCSIVEAISSIIDNPDLTSIKVRKAIDDVKEFDWDIESKKFISYFA
jgi:glycosyltransferase involved in cell wall biosynthesis